MSPITKRFIAGLFTTAPGHFFGNVDRGANRSFAGVFASVRAVAERLFLGFAARAPGIVSGLYDKDKRGVALRAY